MRQLNEINSNLYGSSISFVDIDETTFHTYAKVGVKDSNGNIIKKLNNQEFNTHSLEDGQTYDFSEFRDSKVFNTTSKPIQPIINKIQNAVESIKRNGLSDKVIFLTARSDFNDKELFLKTFRANGIDVDDASVYIERSGNLTNIENVADRKKFVILKYLQTGKYTRVRMIDDDINNLRVFKRLGIDINKGKYGVKKAVKELYPRCNRITFFPLLVNEDGKIRNVKLKESDISSFIEPNILLEIKAYHGSHKNFDNFDVKYIGTGEHCQAHGWGLYFALQSKTSKEYQNRISLSNNDYDAVITYNGKKYIKGSLMFSILELSMNKERYSNDEYKKKIADIISKTDIINNSKLLKDKILTIYNSIKNIDASDIKKQIQIKRGQFFEVELPSLDTFLIEHKVMKNQPEKVIESVKKLLKDLGNPFKARELIGRSFYNKLSYYDLNNGQHLQTQNKPKKISEKLYEYGITGISYDGQSDGPCVVIFNDKDVHVVNKDINYNEVEQVDISEKDIQQLDDVIELIDNDKIKEARKIQLKDNQLNWLKQNKPSVYFDYVGKSIKDKDYFEIIAPYIGKNSKLYTQTMLNYNTEELLPFVNNSPVVGYCVILKYMKDGDFDKCLEFVKSMSLENRITMINGVTFRNDSKLSFSNYSIENFLPILEAVYDGVDYKKINTDSRFLTNYVARVFSRMKPKCSKTLMNALIISSPDEMINVYNDVPYDVLKESEPNVTEFILTDNDKFSDENVNKLLGQWVLNNKCSLRAPNKDILTLDVVYKYYKNYNDMDYFINASILKIIEDFDENGEYKKVIGKILSENMGDKSFLENISAGSFLNKIIIILLENNFLDYSKIDIQAFIEYLKEFDDSYINKVIENASFTNKQLIKLALSDVTLLYKIKSIPYEVQKVLCSRNPYMIKYINNPDPRIIKELSSKYDDIEDYIRRF